MQHLEYLGTQAESTLKLSGIDSSTDTEVRHGNGSFWWNDEDELQAIVEDGDLILSIKYYGAHDYSNSVGFIYNTETDKTVYVLEDVRLNAMAEYILKLMVDY